MKITQQQIRQIIQEEIVREMRRHIGPLRGATFHVDPVTGKYVTGGEDFEGPGGRAAHAVRRPKVMGMKSPAALAHSEVSWDDFAGFGMNQVGEAFVAAGGDPMLALQILQMEAMAAAEDEGF